MTDIEGEWIPPDEIERHWRAFLAGVLHHTVYMCRWLKRNSRSGRYMSGMKPPCRKLENAAFCWQWVFWGPECELTLEEVCLHLGISAPRVRARILEETGGGKDINQLVARTLRFVDERVADGREKSRKANSSVSVDWEALRQYRSVYPVTMSLEDFYSASAGQGQDHVDSSASSGCGVCAGGTEAPG